MRAEQISHVVDGDSYTTEWTITREGDEVIIETVRSDNGWRRTYRLTLEEANAVSQALRNRVGSIDRVVSTDELRSV